MSKENLANVTPGEAHVQTSAVLEQATQPESSRVKIHYFPEPPKPLDLPRTVTQVLENNLTHLESLRASIETARQKHEIDDVRDFGDTMGGQLLRGVEDEVDYTDLVKLITHIKDGIAQRRVALAAV